MKECMTIFAVLLVLVCSNVAASADDGTPIKKPKVLGRELSTVKTYKGPSPYDHTCSGSCSGYPTQNWSCPDGKQCFLNCTTPSSPGLSCF
jgi:hypothetical protein